MHRRADVRFRYSDVLRNQCLDLGADRGDADCAFRVVQIS